MRLAAGDDARAVLGARPRAARAELALGTVTASPTGSLSGGKLLRAELALNKALAKLLTLAPLVAPTAFNFGRSHTLLELSQREIVVGRTGTTSSSSSSEHHFFFFHKNTSLFLVNRQDFFWPPPFFFQTRPRRSPTLLTYLLPVGIVITFSAMVA